MVAFAGHAPCPSHQLLNVRCICSDSALLTEPDPMIGHLKMALLKSIVIIPAICLSQRRPLPALRPEGDKN